ncbi:hypothetical protein [Pseudomonas fluorescens]|uniref:Uncharacterized protein n=1 Tax=Pseudomonas fluorescens TaxID=294 RepID=A0A5E7RIW0_PSEFL|nr:hypothetical protein [Pseudomonas fluorescens]VVP73448.1 hypothetical protein PS941_00044 [Pseudomonas fluorescens]
MTANAQDEKEAAVTTIREMGWLQGDIVSGADLADHIPQAAVDGVLGGKLPSHWVLISHSCSIHARAYDQAPMVEWIALKMMKKKPLGAYLNSNNPRILQLQLDEKLIFEAKIERRIWTPRSVLQSLKRNEDQKLDSEMIQTLSYWLSHSYNRIAIPDKLVERLKFRNGENIYIGLGVAIDSFLSENAHLLKGAWISFYPKEELLDATPYSVAFRLLIKPKHTAKLNELNAKLQEATNLDASEIEGLDIDECLITPLQDFTMLDAEDFTHYNSSDWLSLAEEDEGEGEGEGK